MSMERYSVPKSVFYHVTESRVAEIVRNQRQHEVQVRGAQSVLARNHELELSEGIQRVRFWKKTRLREQMNNNLGTPFSINTQVRGPQQLRMLYTIFQHHGRLRHIKRDPTSHYHNRRHVRSDEKPDRFAKRVRMLKEVAYKSARKRYLGVSWKRTEQQLHPKAPTKPRPKGLRASRRASRRPSSARSPRKDKDKAPNDLEVLIKLEMARLAAQRDGGDEERIDCRQPSSSRRRVEIVRSHTIPQRTTASNVRRTQSARKRPQSARHRPEASASSRRAQSARRSKRKKADPWRKPSVLREILKYAGTAKGTAKFGRTVPEFVRNVQGFMRTRHLGEIHRRLKEKFAPQRTARTSMFCAPAMYRARTARSSMMFTPGGGLGRVRPSLCPDSLQMSAARARARVGIAEDGSMTVKAKEKGKGKGKRARPGSAGPGRRRISVLTPKARPSSNLARGTANRRVSVLSQVTDLKTTQLTAMFKACGGDLDLLETVIASTETAKLEDSAEMEQVVKRVKLSKRPPWVGNTRIEPKSKWCKNTLDAFAEGVRLSDTAWLRRTAYANVMRQKASARKKHKHKAKGDEKGDGGGDGNEVKEVKEVKEAASLLEQLADVSAPAQFEESKVDDVVGGGSARAKEKASPLLSKRKSSREMSSSHVRESFCVGLPSQPSFELERHPAEEDSESESSEKTQPKPAIPPLELYARTGLSTDVFFI